MIDALTCEEALAILAPGDTVHTIRSGAGIIIGCNWKREELTTMIREAPARGLAGKIAVSMGHGLYIVHDGRPLFLATIDGHETAIEAMRGERATLGPA